MKIMSNIVRTKNVERIVTIEFKGEVFRIYKWHSYHHEHGDSSDIEVINESKSDVLSIPNEVWDFANELELY